MTSTAVSDDQPYGGVFAFDPVRLVIGIGLLAAGAAIVRCQGDIRVIEATLSRPILAVVMGQAVHLPGSDSVYYPDYAGPGFRAMTVTTSCSSALISGPLVAIGGILAMVRRFSPWRAAIAMVVAALCMVVVNLGRIAVIAVATHSFDRDGYVVAHRGVGSAMVMAAAAASLIVAYRIVASHPTVEPDQADA